VILVDTGPLVALTVPGRVSVTQPRANQTGLAALIVTVKVTLASRSPRCSRSM
jgi:hypothetical protein